jgi:hypothetical protein
LFFLESYEKIIKIIIDNHNAEEEPEILILDLIMTPSGNIKIALSNNGKIAGIEILQDEYSKMVQKFTEFFIEMKEKGKL